MSVAQSIFRLDRRVIHDCFLDVRVKDTLSSVAKFLETSTPIITESSLFLVLLISTLLLWFLYRSQNQATRIGKHKSVDGKLPPGSTGWPFIGETVDFLLDGRKYFRTRRQLYGCIFRSHLCGSPAVVITGAENVQKVLTAAESCLVQSPPSSILRLFGRGSFSASVGKRHSHLQRCAAKLFSSQNLATFVGPIQNVVRSQIRMWRSLQGPLNGVEACRQLTLSIINQCLFGFDLESTETDQIVRLFEKFSEGVFAFPVDFPGFTFHEAMKARNSLKRIMMECICSTSRRQRSRFSMLDMLHSSTRELGLEGKETEAEEQLEEEDVMSDMVLELFFAAKETTASAMCTALIEIGEQQAVLEKIRSELETVGIEPGDLVDYDCIRHQLVYTNDVVREILRVQPPVAGAFRKTCKPFEIQGYIIPAGWMVLYGITDTHEMSTSFSEVEKFNPDRWRNVRIGLSPASSSATVATVAAAAAAAATTTAATVAAATVAATAEVPGNGEESRQTTETTCHVNKFEYIPFGGGSRRFCVGESMARLILSIFLVEMANWVDGWKLVNGRPLIKTAPIPFPKDSLPILFQH